MANKTIAFCETTAQVDRLVPSGERTVSIDTYLAITPEAAWRLRQREVSYRKPEDFYDEVKLCALSQSVIDRQAQWVDWLDTYLQRAMSEFKEADFFPARCQFYYLKIFLDQLFMGATILDRILDRERFDEVIYFALDNPPPIEWDLFFRESVYSLLLPLFCQARGIKATRLIEMYGNGSGTSGTLQRDAGIGKKLARTVWTHISPKGRAYIRLLMKHGWRPLLSGRRRTDRRAPRLLLQPTHDIEYIWLLARSRSFRCSLWGELIDQCAGGGRELDSLKDRLGRSWMLAKEEQAFWSPFEMAGVDLRAAAEPRLRFWWEQLVPRTWHAFVTAGKFLRELSPAAILLPMASHHTEVAALQAAKGLGVPVVISQHGGFSGSCDYFTWDFTELKTADYLFTYGREAAAYFKSRTGRYTENRAIPVPVGSARLDDVRGKARGRRISSLRQRLGNQDGPVILYVPTIFNGYCRYLDGTYPDVSYFELQCEVTKVFRQFPRLRFVYKPFLEAADSLHNPIPAILREACPNCTVVRDVPLTDLIWAADAIIIDYPSTGLLEALLTESKIVCYVDSRSVQMTPVAMALLRKRALLAETPGRFLEELSRFLAAGDFAREPSSNRDFLKAYGTHLDDGRSAKRGVEMLEDIIRNHPNRDHLMSNLVLVAQN